jgi:hypothetical protein
MARGPVNFEVFYTADELSDIVDGWGKKKFGRVKKGVRGRIRHFEKAHGEIAGDDTPLRYLRGNLQMLATEQGRREQ